MISDNNKTFYAEFTDYDQDQLNPWIIDNVINNLTLTESYTDDCQTSVVGSRMLIRTALIEWLSQFDRVQFIADHLAYDWVLLVDLIATYVGEYPVLPKNVFYIPIDICTLLWTIHYDMDISRESFIGVNNNQVSKHNSLYDANVTKQSYNKYIKVKMEKGL
jgi:hypothetical protein